MKNFITVPNLPEKKITLAAVGNYPEITAALNSLGIKTVSFENKALPEEISRHQDMLLCHIGNERLFLDPLADKASLENEGFSVLTGDEIGNTYPFDVKLNIAVSKDFFIYNPKTADPSLINELKKSGRREIKTKQGYTKCSLCFVTDNAVITEDPSIYEAVQSTGIHGLLISKGDIYLSDKHYGFFGGATGKIDKNTLAVTGSLQYHRDGKKIKDFCHTHGVEILELTDGPITDTGGILPLKS